MAIRVQQILARFIEQFVSIRAIRVQQIHARFYRAYVPSLLDSIELFVSFVQFVFKNSLTFNCYLLVAIDADVPMPSLVEDAARRIASSATGKVSSSTTTSIGRLSMTGSISWSYPAGISSTAAASDPSVSVHQWNV